MGNKYMYASMSDGIVVVSNTGFIGFGEDPSQNSPDAFLPPPVRSIFFSHPQVARTLSRGSAVGKVVRGFGVPPHDTLPSAIPRLGGLLSPAPYSINKNLNSTISSI